MHKWDLIYNSYTSQKLRNGTKKNPIAMRAQQALFNGFHLFSRLHFAIAFQEVALNDRAYDGQTLACLQLGDKSEQSRIFDMKVFIQLQEHQQLRSVSHSEEKTAKKKTAMFDMVF